MTLGGVSGRWGRAGAPLAPRPTAGSDGVSWARWEASTAAQTHHVGLTSLQAERLARRDSLDARRIELMPLVALGSRRARVVLVDA